MFYLSLHYLHKIVKKLQMRLDFHNVKFQLCEMKRSQNSYEICQ